MTDLMNDFQPQAALRDADRLGPPDEAIAWSEAESESLPRNARHFRITDVQEWIDLCA